MSQSLSSSNQFKIVRKRHSFYETRSPSESVTTKSGTFSRSDINIIRTNDFPSIIDSGCVNRYGLPVKESNSEEYYKKYEHDDVPVKDGGSCSGDISDNANGDRKELTNSDLEKMEVRIFKNISKELQTDDSMDESHHEFEHNLKLFKTTVQEIFDNFNSNMSDFEHYKKQYQEILSKNKEKTIAEMEYFIKDMIHHIISSESCITNGSNATNTQTISEICTDNTNAIDSATYTDVTADDHNIIPLEPTVEAYKNENYFTDSTVDRESSKLNRSDVKEKTYNIYLLNGDPCVEIKMNGRNLLSEINIRNSQPQEADQIASAENIKKLAAKKLQLQKYMNHRMECQSNDKIIPIKISYAKKNIHSKDCLDDVEESNKSFIFRICNYFCRKLRKHSFG